MKAIPCYKVAGGVRRKPRFCLRLFVLLAMLLLSAFFSSSAWTVYTSSLVDRKYEVSSANGSNNSETETVIPKIIHQIWNDEYIPDIYVDKIKSLIRDNPFPEWQYCLWTFNASRELLRQRFPDMLPFFDDTKNVNSGKSNIARYAILHEIGGVYFDIDTYSVKPLDPFIAEYVQSGCVFSYEPPEHELWYDRTAHINNAFLMCRAQHPVFVSVLESIPGNHKLNCPNSVLCSGPGALTQVIETYVKQGRNQNHSEEFQLLESDYFESKADKTLARSRFKSLCEGSKEKMITDPRTYRFRIKFCNDNYPSYEVKTNIKAITVHTYDHIDIRKVTSFTHITKIVPHVNFPVYHK